MEIDIKKKKAFKVTLWGSLIDLCLGVAKIVTGSIFHSQALIIDGFHSLSDLLTDGFVLIVSKYSYDHPDEEHPYGHGKFETLGTVVIGVVLMLVAIFLAIDNLNILLGDAPRMNPGWPTLIIAAISILAKEFAYRFTLKVGKELKSQILIANAWHSRTDAYSSILVFVGLIFSIVGVPKIDLFMAIVLSFFIGKVGWDFIWGSIKELVDTSLDAETRKEIKKVIHSIDGVKGLHNLRSRKVGDKAILDVNIEVSPRISVSEGHEIATWVAYSIKGQVQNIYDVTVHTDVEDDRDDEQDFISYEKELLPLRKEIEKNITDEIGEDSFKNFDSIIIHYYEDKVGLDIYCCKDINLDVEPVKSKILKNNLIKEVKFYRPL
ncbi:MAG: cation diffusion facilitator family transporter [Bacteriovoracaceae bacterium]|jgi:cation diffusion facilitator family transporter